MDCRFQDVIDKLQFYRLWIKQEVQLVKCRIVVVAVVSLTQCIL